MSLKAVSDLIGDEMRARRWAVSQVSNRCGLPYDTVLEILDAKRQITRADAKCLEDGFGPSAEFWLNLSRLPEPVPVGVPPPPPATGAAAELREIVRNLDAVLEDGDGIAWYDAIEATAKELRALAAHLAPAPPAADGVAARLLPPDPATTDRMARAACNAFLAEGGFPPIEEWGSDNRRARWEAVVRAVFVALDADGGGTDLPSALPDLTETRLRVRAALKNV